jgi:hypothetical protein
LELLFFDLWHDAIQPYLFFEYVHVDQSLLI